MHSTDVVEDGYMGSGSHLRSSLKKHGLENHVREVLSYFPDRESLREHEVLMLTAEILNDPLCMNQMGGGNGNESGFWELSKVERKEAARLKISETSKAMWAKRKEDPVALAEFKAKINKPEHHVSRAEGNKAKGHKRTPEQLKIMKAGQVAHYASQTPEQNLQRIQKSTWARVKTYIVEGSDGSIQNITNIQKFSAEHNIKGTALYKTEIRKNFTNGYRIVGRA